RAWGPGDGPCDGFDARRQRPEVVRRRGQPDLASRDTDARDQQAGAIHKAADLVRPRFRGGGQGQGRPGYISLVPDQPRGCRLARVPGHAVSERDAATEHRGDGTAGPEAERDVPADGVRARRPGLATAAEMGRNLRPEVEGRDLPVPAG